MITSRHIDEERLQAMLDAEPQPHRSEPEDETNRWDDMGRYL